MTMARTLNLVLLLVNPIYRASFSLWSLWAHYWTALRTSNFMWSNESWCCVKLLTCLCSFKYTNKNVLLLQRWAVSMLKVVSTLVQSSFLEKSMMAAAVMIHSVKQSFCIALYMSQLLNPAPIMSSTQIQYWTGINTLLVSSFAMSKLNWFW